MFLSISVVIHDVYFCRVIVLCKQMYEWMFECWGKMIMRYWRIEEVWSVCLSYSINQSMIDFKSESCHNFLFMRIGSYLFVHTFMSVFRTKLKSLEVFLSLKTLPQWISDRCKHMCLHIRRDVSLSVQSTWHRTRVCLTQCAKYMTSYQRKAIHSTTNIW